MKDGYRGPPLAEILALKLPRNRQRHDPIPRIPKPHFVYRAQYIRAATSSAKSDTMGTATCEEALVLVEVGAVVVPVALEEVLLPLDVLLTSLKLAQVRRVLLAKCNVKEPLPKKAFEPARVEA